MNNYREHYTPPHDTGLHGPYTRKYANFADLVLVWLSGCAVGVVLTLMATGN
jgi:hypothetical protein